VNLSTQREYDVSLARQHKSTRRFVQLLKSCPGALLRSLTRHLDSIHFNIDMTSGQLTTSSKRGTMSTYSSTIALSVLWVYGLLWFWIWCLVLLVSLTAVGKNRLSGVAAYCAV
jgi:hypothetical protein